MYLEYCIDNGFVAAKESMYRRVFNTDYNISFQARKKDQCNYCVAFENSTQMDEKRKRSEYEDHIRNKEESRRLKNEDKQRAKTDCSFVAACLDLQQVLQCPYGEVNLYYYKRKLSVYNLSMYNMANGEGYCYIWDESISGRGACEIASCIYSFLKDCAAKGVKEVLPCHGRRK